MFELQVLSFYSLANLLSLFLLSVSLDDHTDTLFFFIRVALNTINNLQVVKEEKKKKS